MRTASTNVSTDVFKDWLSCKVYISQCTHVPNHNDKESHDERTRKHMSHLLTSLMYYISTFSSKHSHFIIVILWFMLRNVSFKLTWGQQNIWGNVFCSLRNVTVCTWWLAFGWLEPTLDFFCSCGKRHCKYLQGHIFELHQSDTLCHE